ncbi:hypothetical protein FJZ36_05110 [Candidatus Poribacteria bacterium]|nr:hypothetical protein [Candidatus Poribacteria bacterium]
MRTGIRIASLGVLALLIAGSASVAMDAFAANPKYNRVARRGTPKVDGALDDAAWKGADWQEMDVFAGGANRPKGFGAKSAVLWDDNYLYTAIEVDDETHAVPKAVVPDAVNLWKGDSPQHRMDLEYDSFDNSPDDVEWGYALQDKAVLQNAWASPGNIEFTSIKIVREDGAKKTYYETAVVITMHKPKQKLTAYVKENPKAKMGYSDMVNANDGADRLGWVEWSSGIGAAKAASQFGTLTFDSAPQAVDPAGKAATTWAELRAAY